MKRVAGVGVTVLSATACGGGSTSPSKAIAATSSTTLATSTSTTAAATSTSTTAAATSTSTTAAPGVAPTATTTTTRAAPATTTTTAAPAPAPPPPADAAITVQGFAFNPPTLTIAVGTTVTVTNKDGASHTWTADGGAWNQPLAPGGTASRRFDSAGTFTYHCAIHPSMTGKVVVGSSPA